MQELILRRSQDYIAVREGPARLARRLLGAVQVLPGVERLITAVLRREVRGFLHQVDKERRSDGRGKTLAMPEKVGNY